MPHRPATSTGDVASEPTDQATKPCLRFITCATLGDGKSTLIGCLLKGSKSPAGDQSDAANRTFATETRLFVTTDGPDDEDDTGSMISGALGADLAVILVDAPAGVLTQTRRRAYLATLLGIRHLVLAVNKMDLVGFSEARFAEISAEFEDFAAALSPASLSVIPVCALEGDNLVRASDRMDWYQGPTLLELLDSVDPAPDPRLAPLRFSVHRVEDQDAGLRVCHGTLVSGQVRRGDRVLVAAAEQAVTVERIEAPGGELERAVAGQSVALVLDAAVEVGGSDLLVETQRPPEQSDQVAAHVIWLHQEPMLPERQYLLKLGDQTATAQVTDLRYQINVNSLERPAAQTLAVNDIGYCNLGFDRSLVFDAYRDNRHTGAFTLIDRFTEETVGAGLIDFGLRRAANLTWHETEVDKVERAKKKGQKPCVLWFTGLSGSGKSTVANLVERKLNLLGAHTYLLDGDNVRHGLNRDLGFTDQDRVENIRRIAEVSRLFVDAGLIVVVAFISPFRGERQMARELMESGEFVEIFMDTPLAVCEERDPKGLYKKARAGNIANFTGIDSAYEPPLSAEITLRSERQAAEESAEQIVDHLKSSGYLA